MSIALEDSQYTITLDFGENENSPSRYFLSLSKIMDFCYSLDSDFVRCVDSSAHPLMILENVHTGSLVARLVTFLKSVDDEGLKSLNFRKIFGAYLVNVKYKIIAFLENRQTISSSEEIIELQAELIECAEKVGQNPLSPPAFTKKDVINYIVKYQDAISELKEGDKVYYLPADERARVKFNTSFEISSESIEDLVSDESIDQDMDMILQVKKPDYLGNSKWDFRHNKRVISAKIFDEDWLEEFRNRRLIIYPGDAIRATVRCVVKYSRGTVISETYEIKKVIRIIREDIDSRQMNIFDSLEELNEDEV